MTAGRRDVGQPVCLAACAATARCAGASERAAAVTEKGYGITAGGPAWASFAMFPVTL